MADSARMNEAIFRLRAAGERVTPGRRGVLGVLEESRRHMDAEAIAAAVAERVPGVHRATIYRSLQALVDVGLVSHTHVAGGATIYHLALHSHTNDGKPEFHAHGHAHLQCTTCERFVDVPSGLFDDLREQLLEQVGFSVDVDHAALLGTCAQCAEAQRK